MDVSDRVESGTEAEETELRMSKPKEELEHTEKYGFNTFLLKSY